MHVKNTAATGSLLTAEDIDISIVIEGDIIRSNMANSGTINAGTLANIYISDTQFINNTNVAPTIFITNSVNSFSCTRCIFQQNIAEFEGIVSIASADQVIFDYLDVRNNDVNVGSMIMIKKSINTNITSSLFNNNLCSNLPCAVSVKKTDQIKIEYFSLVSNMSVTDMVSHSNDQKEHKY